MGLFDSVMADCPNCGARVEFQTKADIDPYCRVLSPAEATDDMIYDLSGDAQRCEKCGCWVGCFVDPPRPPKPSVRFALVKAPAVEDGAAGAFYGIDPEWERAPICEVVDPAEARSKVSIPYGDFSNPLRKYPVAPPPAPAAADENDHAR